MHPQLIPPPFQLSTQTSKYPDKLWPISAKLTVNNMDDIPSYSNVATDVQSIFHQPALSWVGKIFDWFFDPAKGEATSIENRKILIKKPQRAKNTLVASRLHQQALTSFLLEMKEDKRSQFGLQPYEITSGSPNGLNNRQSRNANNSALSNMTTSYTSNQDPDGHFPWFAMICILGGGIIAGVSTNCILNYKLKAKQKAILEEQQSLLELSQQYPF